MFTFNYIRHGVLAVVTTLAMLALATPPVLAASPASDGSPLVFTPVNATSDPAVRRAAAALGMPSEKVNAPFTRTPVSGSRASLEAVVCYVGGSAPHRASATDNRLINTTVSVTCTGEVRLITISIWLLWSFDDMSFSTLSNRLNERSKFSPFMVGTTGVSEPCLPQYYIGLAHIWVNFLDGYPLEDGGWFSTDSVWIPCG